VLDRSCPRRVGVGNQAGWDAAAVAEAIRSPALGLWRARCRVGWDVLGILRSVLPSGASFALAMICTVVCQAPRHRAHCCLNFKASQSILHLWLDALGLEQRRESLPRVGVYSI
jgi:hypothetical protein